VHLLFQGAIDAVSRTRGDLDRRSGGPAQPIRDHPPVQRGELNRIGITAALVVAAGLAHYIDVPAVLAFLVAAAAIATLT
jgi:hypothetical protein